ncbi:hypothetical protein D3C87_1855270 [compost metagenome]
MEECHLHYGIDTRRQTAFAGNFCSVDSKQTRLLLVQYGLNFLRQTGPHFVGVVRRVNQENPAGFQAFSHLIFIDKLQLVAADEISL